jgi:gluconokinase
MGVCGTGKSTVGARLADALGWTYADADDFHPPTNVAKMQSGTPLDDADRWPWLDRLHALLAEHNQRSDGIVLACSALKASYRQRLAVDPRCPCFVYLHGTRELLAGRLAARQDHYMPPTLLDSQLATLEEPTLDEAIHCNVAQTPGQIVMQVIAALRTF